MSEEQRDSMDVDVVLVGAGPANLAAAYRLAELTAEHNKSSSDKLELAIALLEKGKEIGSHALSGAVLDPRSLRELFPDDWENAPFEGEVKDEQLLWLRAGGAMSLPIPPPLHNDGNQVVSLGRLVKWMASKVENMGVDIFCEFPATEVLLENNRVVGVRTGDRGVDRDGERKANFEPGVDLRARAVVLGEGPRGTLSKQLESMLDLHRGKNPQIYSIGIKEVWKVPDGRFAPGQVIHTLGWPLDRKTFGGGFLYGMADNLVIVGLVVGLDYENPWLDPHTEFQRFKTHPRIAPILRGGEMSFYGAKALPEGGWWSMPELAGQGFVIVGDAGGFLNSERLKGIHLAIKSGMLAAETIFQKLIETRNDPSQPLELSGFKDKVEESWIKQELWRVRNFHQAFDRGLFGGMLQAGLGMVSGGRGWGFKNRLTTTAGYSRMIRLDSPEGSRLERQAPLTPDGELTFDRLADVYNSGTAHSEDQPVHLRVADPSICSDRCAREYANPCQRFCPAAVYEMATDPSTPSGKRLQINASNCVHCKTCDIMDPYQIITWVPPEGGGGPSYGKM